MDDQADSAAVPDDTTGPAELSEMTEGLAAQGFAVVEGYPANHRLRAEALVADGKDTDPAGYIPPELIADTADRLAREAKAAAAEHPKNLDRLKRDDLFDLAAAEGVTVETDANKATIIKAIEANRAGKEG